MTCLPLYRLLMAAILLTGATAASRFGHAWPGDPCRGRGQVHPCALLATPPAGLVRPARSAARADLMPPAAARPAGAPGIGQARPVIDRAS